MKKVTKLEKVYEDMDLSFSKVSDDKLQEVIANLKKEIEGKKSSLTKMQESESTKKEEMDKNIKTLEKRLNNLEGYSKNRTQITRIRNYKSTLEQKLSQSISQKKECDKRIENLTPILKKLTEQLNDKQYMKSLNISQLPNILSKKESIENAIKENQETSKQLEARIMELQAKVGKCDLAWKTLFTNKDWDEIQRRAITNNRFTRKVDEKNLPISSAKKEEKQQEEQKFNENEVKQQIGNFVTKVKGEQTNLPAPVSKWDKIKNFFKRIPMKLKEKFGKEKTQSAQPLQQQPDNYERDKFIESLRQYADEGYRNQVRQDKEQQYMEKHAIKPKEEKRQEEER